ncbi:hypothetical protein L5515_015669 [Caenorhabditis briggsae]|uniref:BTB domain-containing protein n=1 Tax=Caenorhabditis briggsae TaxID=6238 RepID=A0AAE9JA99_CAEBR|nr:hypothetical protein L5515_015669 [Caenorhabditis briggsae]
MGDNNEEIGKNPKIDTQTEKFEILEKLNSQEQKFDEFAKKLQSIEESVSKNQNKKELKSEKRFALKNVFKNVTSLEEGRCCNSEKEEHFNVKWSIQIERQGSSYFEIVVSCVPVAPVGDEWSIETKLEFRVMGNDDNSVIKTMKFCFEPGREWILLDFLKWEEIRDNYLIDGNLTVEVEIEILKMTGFGKKKFRKFDESQKDVSDVLLVVQDTKFYVSKTYLAAQSSFFKTLFFGNFSESSKSEIPLSGIDSDDFQRFLEVLYGESVIDDSTVEEILHIADMYATPMVVRRCEEFLLKKSAKSAKKLLGMAARYNLENLKNNCMSGIKTVADIRAVLPSVINDLDSRIMAELLEKALSLH